MKIHSFFHDRWPLSKIGSVRNSQKRVGLRVRGDSETGVALLALPTLFFEQELGANARLF
jgi:hypothetical protein